MNALDLTRLTPCSTLASLETHYSQVNVNTLGQAVNDKFTRQPELPGVIVRDGEQILGMISRKVFLERMSQRYSIELYLNRPIKNLLNILKLKALQLPATHRIEVAARMALSRSAEAVYEPIVVVQENQDLHLLDMNVLLLAQSQILSSLLVENQLRNQILETQKAELQAQADELREQAQKILKLNQQFFRISELLSSEGKAAFFATFTGVKSICRATSQVVSTGQDLEKEIEDIDEITKLIDSVSKQVRQLAAQAAIIVNKSGKQIAELIPISTELRNLGEQTFAVSSHVNQLVSRFQFFLKDLKVVAQAGETTANALLQKSEQAQFAFIELEKLVNENNKLGTPKS
ncbi:MAG: hypothetical protein JOZ78_19165 [Chroococcidiopsidaceae cyanobacterium CP_BM_ER_R8_30]|nr:hypothetical protein [Chroococcidiopsidaceae cyanobacterium CP_BM_ER_R8_30]